MFESSYKKIAGPGVYVPGRRTRRGPEYTRFFRSGLSAYVGQVGEYVGHIPLLVRDLEFQFEAARQSGGAGDSLEAVAVTAHGIKFSSRGILAEETVRKAGDIENAALSGDMERLREKMPVFLDYMDFFIEGLKKFLEKEKRR